MKRIYNIAKGAEINIPSDMYTFAEEIYEEVDVCGVPARRWIKNRNNRISTSMFKDLLFKMRNNERIEEVINWV